jgi:O-antigen/teichoic acid export membrane protein
MRSLGRLTKFHGPGWSIVDQSLVSAVNFLSIFLLARGLPPGEFGVLMVAYTGLLVLVSLQQAFVAQPHNYLGAPLEGREFARFTASLALIQVVSSAAFCLLLALCGALVVASGFAYYGKVTIALAAAAFPWLIQDFMRRAFYTKSRAKSAAANDLLSYGLQLAAIVWLTRSELSAIEVLLIYGASSLVGVFFGAVQLRSWFDFSGAGSLASRVRQTAARTWKFGKWLVAQSTVSWFGMSGDTWLIAGLLGTEAVGTYRAVVHLAGVLNPLRQASAAYLPARASLVLHRGGRVRLGQWVRRTASLLQLAVIPVALVFIVFPGPILQLAYGNKFSGYETLLALDVVAVVLEFSRFPLGVAILAMMSSRTMFKVHLIPVALLPTAGVLLVLAFGIFGVPWFHIISATATLIVTLVIYRRHMRRVSPGLPLGQPAA